MPTFERLISAVETAEQIRKERSDDESSAIDIGILPLENADSLAGDKEVQDDDLMIDHGLSSNLCGAVQVQTIFLSGQDNDDEVGDDDNAKEEKTDSRA